MAILTRQSGVFSIALLTICIMILSTGTDNVDFPEFTDNDMAAMRVQIKDMFYHAYGNYMDLAFPADELKPISCKPRERGENRGSLDDVLGDFSLTLVDSLDMLLVLGDVDEFSKAVQDVITTVRFNKDVNVSVFETTIRVLGGLLSAHLQAEERLPEYKGELLTMSVDLANRLLPAFNTKTGIPYSRVNLLHGLIPKEKPESCTACAGTLIMEFGLLSKLTKNTVYETVAKEALKALYNRRSALGLVATTINVNSGQWTSRDSGIGAGIDSYYEYLLKAYLMFGDEEYYHMFNVSYAAVMKHIKKDHFYTNVDLVSGQLKYNWIDSLSAFWPGLQVLAGDVPNAEQAWSKYYFAWRKHSVGLPERFDFLQLGATLKHYPLRPEFIESTYFLYQATKNPFYLHVGREIFNGLKTHTKTECGYATVTDVETKTLEDRMDSFFLTEVCKYLYLLFDPDNFVTKENFIFTTEGHFFPMQYSYLNNSQSKQPVTERCKMARKKIETFDDLTAPLVAQAKNKTRLAQCDVKEGKHARELNVTAVNLPKYVITGLDPQLIGGIFVNLVPKSREAQLIFTAEGQQVKMYAGQADFGPGVPPDGLKSHEVVQVQPSDGCAQLITPLQWTQGRVVVVDRGNCPFVQKIFYAQRAGATAAIVIDNVPKNGIFMMVNNAQDEEEPEIVIPSVLISYEDGLKLRKHLIDPTLLIETKNDEDIDQQDSYAQETVTSLLPLRADLIPLGTREDDQRLEFMVETKQKINQELFARAGIRLENNMVVFYANENFKADDPRLGGGPKENNGKLPEGFTVNMLLDPRESAIDLLHVDEYNNKQQKSSNPTPTAPESNNQPKTDVNNKIDP